MGALDAALRQRARVDCAKDRSPRPVRHGHDDLRRAEDVEHDAVARATFHFDEFASAGMLHRLSVLANLGSRWTGVERLRATYVAFNARDIDAVLAQMTADVDWPNAWEGGRVQGRDAVRG
jgi:hypothetical protein